MITLAVVVTHNRADLLSRCIDHIQLQTQPPDAIVVINNASTDGTVDMLERRGVAFITQENLGSAGGWSRGIQRALEGGFDAVWLMDDDGFPDANALALLQAALTPDVACTSSVVLREDCPTHFVFPFPILDDDGFPVIFGQPRNLTTLEALHTIAPDGTYPFAHLFNGALISIEAIRKVGNVDQSFFMSGDEVDYFCRLRKAGRVVSILDAWHYHPDVSRRPYTPAKVYYYVKNTLILNKRYFNAVWLRHSMAVAAVLIRIFQRNGLGTALSYLFGRNASTLSLAIVRGFRGQIGKDFDA